MATSLGLASQLREWNRQYQDVPDPAFVAASHFNRLIILLLDTMPRESPILEEQELGLRHEITVKGKGSSSSKKGNNNSNKGSSNSNKGDQAGVL